MCWGREVGIPAEGDKTRPDKSKTLAGGGEVVPNVPLSYERPVDAGLRQEIDNLPDAFESTSNRLSQTSTDYAWSILACRSSEDCLCSQ